MSDQEPKYRAQIIFTDSEGNSGSFQLDWNNYVPDEQEVRGAVVFTLEAWQSGELDSGEVTIGVDRGEATLQ